MSGRPIYPVPPVMKTLVWMFDPFESRISATVREGDPRAETKSRTRQPSSVQSSP